MTSAPSTDHPPTTDLPTVAALSALAYLLATALHEHLGHALSCAALGGHLRELGAFYVDCDYRAMPGAAIRFVALAGPLLSLLTGLLSFAALRATPPQGTHRRVFLWLLGSIGLMTATGYLLFSGVTGLGDFGTSRDGLLYHAAPEGLWRGMMGVLGLAGYLLTVRVMLRSMDSLIGGAGRERVARAQRLSLTAYLTGGVVSLLIGVLNPVGVVILLTSAAAASLGGTSALAWGMMYLNRKKDTGLPPLILPRSWAWIAAGIIFTVAYGLILGPSLRPGV
ncbi:hypothetical protein [Deinococcus sp.]|uniref:hypothetical protein n=1 Tax=Deinococcus sp. TaxID=47478 RepID=UPI002869E22C|nr:hypothetical protein [Deinococcus sp.]